VGQTIEDRLRDARSHLERISPEQALVAQRDGAFLIDIRPVEQRKREGEVPGAAIIGRTVLEWRLCASSSHQIPDAPGREDLVIVLCSQGYASSLAAAELQLLGFDRATDVDGGFVAWVEAGLPVQPSAGATDEELHGPR
jgi:rhodanese-related sulfurtransferase